MAPGPPPIRAAPTPTMLPVPMVAPRAVHRLCRGLMLPASSRDRSGLRRRMAPRVCPSHRGRRRSWNQPVRTVIHSPAAASSPTPSGPHTAPLIAASSCIMPRTSLTHKNRSHTTAVWLLLWVCGGKAAYAFLAWCRPPLGVCRGSRPARSRAGRTARYSSTAQAVETRLFTRVTPPATPARAWATE